MLYLVVKDTLTAVNGECGAFPKDELPAEARHTLSLI